MDLMILVRRQVTQQLLLTIRPLNLNFQRATIQAQSKVQTTVALCRETRS